MPRASKGARLYADRKRGQWIIRDGAAFIRTGHSLADRGSADQALARYIAGKYTPPRRHGDPDTISIDAVLAAYAAEHAPHTKAPETIAYAIKALAPFWSGKTLSDIRASTCRAYTAQRERGAGTVRRELGVLAAAIRHWHREHGPLTAIPAVTMPEPPPARLRWLTRSEAAAMLWACLGWRAVAFSVATRQPVKWQRAQPVDDRRHLARFFLIGLYTGSRSRVIRQASWDRGGGGWFDLSRGIFHRAEPGSGSATKRAPPVRLNARLLAHLRRWREIDRANGMQIVVAYQGAAVGSIKTAWRSAVERAGLDAGVVPHVLRHTRATWMWAAHVPVHEAAASLGMTVEIYEAVYAHADPAWQARAAAV